MSSYREHPIVNVPKGKALRVRPGTSTEYNTANPILKDTELGVTTDTHVIRIGDNSSAWDELPPLQAGTLLIENGADVPTGTAIGTIIFEKA